MRVIIMRGVPGSGKSTWIRDLKESSDQNIIVCSADDYWLDENGEYKFVPSKLPEAHKACLRRFTQLLQYSDTVDILIVDNTNIQLHEIAPYLKFAELYDVEISIVRIKCDVTTAQKRNVHGVPAKTVQSMADRMEKLPGYWPKEVVVKTD